MKPAAGCQAGVTLGVEEEEAEDEAAPCEAA